MPFGKGGLGEICVPLFAFSKALSFNKASVIVLWAFVERIILEASYARAGTRVTLSWAVVEGGFSVLLASAHPRGVVSLVT